MSTTKGNILIKHMASCAADGLVDYEIDWPAKTVTVSMRRSWDGKPFFSSSVLVDLAAYLSRLDGVGIDIADRDRDDSFYPTRSDWNVAVVLGDVRFHARIIIQCKINGYQGMVELGPWVAP